MTKICSKCDTDKPIGDYYLQRGKPMSHCKKCHIAQNVIKNRERRAKIWYSPEEIAKRRAYYDKNKEYYRGYRKANLERDRPIKLASYHRHKHEILAKSQIKRDANREAHRIKCRAVRHRNLEHYRKKSREYVRERRKRDPQFRILGNLRARIRMALRDKSECTRDLLGCSLDHFIKHLESQFAPEMSWTNYGSYWSIDHIRPCASFDLTDESQQRECFNWRNCQPLTIPENSAKRDRYDGEKAADFGVSSDIEPLQEPSNSITL